MTPAACPIAQYITKELYRIVVCSLKPSTRCHERDSGNVKCCLQLDGGADYMVLFVNCICRCNLHATDGIKNLTTFRLTNYTP